MSELSSLYRSTSHQLRTAIQLQITSSGGLARPVLALTLKLSVIRRQIQEVIAEVIPQAAADQSSTSEEPPMDRLVAESIGKQGESWGALLQRLDILVQLGDQLTEVSAQH